MIVLIVVISVALMGLFVAVAIAGNRAHDRLNADSSKNKASQRNASAPDSADGGTD